MTEKCEFCGYPLASYQDQVEHSSLHHPNVDPELTNGSVSPAQTENRNESNTELTQKRTNGSVSPAQMDTTEYPFEEQNAECDAREDSPCVTITFYPSPSDALEVESVAMAILVPGWTEIAYVEDGEVRTILRYPPHNPVD